MLSGSCWLLATGAHDLVTPARGYGYCYSWFLTTAALVLALTFALGAAAAAPVQTFVLCAIAKWEDAYIDEWLGYHLRLGIDRIYVYDNSEDFTMRNKSRPDSVELVHFTASDPTHIMLRPQSRTLFISAARPAAIRPACVSAQQGTCDSPGSCNAIWARRGGLMVFGRRSSAGRGTWDRRPDMKDELPSSAVTPRPRSTRPSAAALTPPPPPTPKPTQPHHHSPLSAL